MLPLVHALLAFGVDGVRSRIGRQREIVALRHQLALYRQSIRRPAIRPTDRLCWVWLARHGRRWQEVLVFVPPAPVIAWQRKRFRDHGARLSRRKPGRPVVR